MMANILLSKPEKGRGEQFSLSGIVIPVIIIGDTQDKKDFPLWRTKNILISALPMKKILVKL